MSRQSRQDLRQALYSKNPVLARGAALTILVMASTSLPQAAFVSAVTLLTLLPALLLADLVARLVGRSLLLPVYLLISALAYIPVSLVFSALFPLQADALGLYLPLTAVCGVSLFFFDGEDSRRPCLSLPARLVQALTFALALCLCGGIRDWMSSWLKSWLGGLGSVGNTPTLWDAGAIHLPVTGFLVLGLVTALLQALRMGFYWLRRRRPPRVPKRQDPDKTMVY